MHQKLTLLFLLTGLTLFSFSYAQEVVESDTAFSIHSDTSSYHIPTQQPEIIIDSLISFAKGYLRKPYNYRPYEHVRFDCSGFSSYVYGQFGYALKRSSAEQARQFNQIERTQLKTGDLVFFSGRRNNNLVGHVGIVVNTYENGKFDFIHASNQSGIVISHSDEDYYARRYIKAGRVINANTSISENAELAIQKPDQDTTNNKEIYPEHNETPAPALTYHDVQKGDTLYAIARKYGISVANLKKQNQLNTDKILPKQRLIITQSTI
jgi:LysM repeat protein